jgi:uncharacterized protein YndB with AHSA1/START domain
MNAQDPPAAAPRLRWPPAADERVTRVDGFVLIGRPIEAVFEFATTAALWGNWHPATESVRAPLRPLVQGERADEAIRVGRRRLSASWTVVACEPPHLWVIGASPAAGDARIVVELRSDAPQLTRFFRTLDYRSRRFPWTLLDGSVTRAALQRVSDRALLNLKRVLESPPRRAGATGAPAGR